MKILPVVEGRFAHSVSSAKKILEQILDKDEISIKVKKRGQNIEGSLFVHETSSFFLQFIK